MSLCLLVTVFVQSVLQMDTPGRHELTWTHLYLTHLDTPGWPVLTWKPCMEDTPASLGSVIYLEWTHLDTPGMDTPGPTFKIIGYTWKVGTHLEALNTGAMEPLTDSSRQLPWITVTHDLTGKDVFWKVIELTGTLT